MLVDGFRAAGEGSAGQTVVDAVQADDVVCAEETVDEEAPHSGDAVLSEDIEGVIDTDPELDCEELVANLRLCRQVETYSW